jgi:SAM-dependent methyltransferase
MEYKVHDVQWNDEKVKRFWDFFNNYSAFDDIWFTKIFGRQILRYVGKIITLSGEVLDYGIGKGHLSEYLTGSGLYNVSGCDFSKETVAYNNKRFAQAKNFKGCFVIEKFPSGFNENQFDFVFLIETIEHLTDDYLTTTLAEIRRILKPGGKIIVTTPNNETLARQNVICPDCGCVFHRVQHIRAFNKTSLTDLTTELGYRKLHCEATDFSEYGSKGFIYKFANNIRGRVSKFYEKPHLVYIGEKVSG